jgi:hypothetical protein
MKAGARTAWNGLAGLRLFAIVRAAGRCEHRQRDKEDHAPRARDESD